MRARSGFTLVELMVALALSGIVVLMAHAMFGSIVDGARRALLERERLDRAANARRVLVSLVGSIDLASPGAEDFIGEPDSVTFTTWTSRRSGWPVMERVTLVGCTGALCAIAAHETLRLEEGVDSVLVDYLIHPGASEAWARRWRSPSSAPAAIRLRIAHAEHTDTLLLTVGERG